MLIFTLIILFLLWLFKWKMGCAPLLFLSAIIIVAMMALSLCTNPYGG